MSALDLELDRLAEVNQLTRRELDDAVFAMRARMWRELGKIATDADIIAALRLGIAADAAKREGAAASAAP